MSFWSRFGKPIIIAALLGLTALVLFSASGRLEIPFFSSGIRFLSRPLTGLTQGLVDNARTYLIKRTYDQDLEAAFLQLSEEHEALKAEVLALSEASEENKRLLEQQKYIDTTPEHDFHAARVIGRHPDSSYMELVIDQGAKQGIRKWDPVVTAKGLIGYIVDTTDSTARVCTLLDTRCSVSGLVERSRDNGLVRGNMISGSNGDPCRMEFLPFDALLVPGDRVITSGMDQLMPKGLVIGNVTQISRNQGVTPSFASIQPAEDILRVENVLIMVDGTSEGKPDRLPIPTATPSAAPKASPTPAPQGGP